MYCYRFVSKIGSLRFGPVCLALVGDLWVISMRCIYHLSFESSEKFRYNRQPLARFISFLLFTFNSNVWYSRSQMQNRVANLWNEIACMLNDGNNGGGDSFTIIAAIKSNNTHTHSHTVYSANHCQDAWDGSWIWLTMDSYFCCIYKSTSDVGANQMK